MLESHSVPCWREADAAFRTFCMRGAGDGFLCELSLLSEGHDWSEVMSIDEDGTSSSSSLFFTLPLLASMKHSIPGMVVETHSFLFYKVGQQCFTHLGE